MPATVACPRCLHQASAAPPPPGGGLAAMDCPRCRTRLTLEVYPKLFAGRRGPGEPGGGLMAGQGDAVCQFYPGLQAETVCEECGCLMSAKAAVQWGQRTLCLPCLHQLREARKADAFSARRTLHANVALGLVIFLAPFSMVTAPAALYILLRHRKTPGSLLPRGAWRWWLALVLAAAVTAGWIFLAVVWVSLVVRAAGGGG